MLQKQQRSVNKCFLAPLLCSLPSPLPYFMPFSICALYEKEIYSKLIRQVLFWGKSPERNIPLTGCWQSILPIFLLLYFFVLVLLPQSAKVNRIQMFKIFVRQSFKETHLSYIIKATGKQRSKGLKCMTPAAGGLHVFQLFPTKESLQSFSVLLNPVAELLNSPATFIDPRMIQILNCRAQRGSKQVMKITHVKHRAQGLACISILQPLLS